MKPDVKDSALRAVRAAIRADMDDHDWCLGGDRVEVVFREWLGEPEHQPERAPSGGRPTSSAEMAALWERAVKAHPLWPDESIFGRLLR